VVKRVRQQGHRRRAQYHPRHSTVPKGLKELATLQRSLACRRRETVGRAPWPCSSFAPAAARHRPGRRLPARLLALAVVHRRQLLRATGRPGALGMRVPLFHWIGRARTTRRCSPTRSTGIRSGRTSYFRRRDVAEAAAGGIAWRSSSTSGSRAAAAAQPAAVPCRSRASWSGCCVIGILRSISRAHGLLLRRASSDGASPSSKEAGAPQRARSVYMWNSARSRSCSSWPACSRSPRISTRGRGGRRRLLARLWFVTLPAASAPSCSSCWC